MNEQAKQERQNPMLPKIKEFLKGTYINLVTRLLVLRQNTYDKLLLNLYYVYLIAKAEVCLCGL